MEVKGIKIKFRSSDGGVINEVFNEKPYRVEEIPLGSTVIDIGAHIGTFTLRCVKERGCFVYAYEPCPENYELLIENLNLNRLRESVKTFNQAVAGRHELREFYTNPEHQAGSSLYLDFYKELDHLPLKEDMIQCTTLKRVFEDNGISHCEVLKMDCEEAEREIFSGESDLYFNRADYIVIEWHNYDGHIYARQLRRLGFDVQLFGTGAPQPAYKRSMGGGMLYAKKFRERLMGEFR